jgi:hypothetical protein
VPAAIESDIANASGLKFFIGIVPPECPLSASARRTHVPWKRVFQRQRELSGPDHLNVKTF